MHAHAGETSYVNNCCSPLWARNWVCYVVYCTTCFKVRSFLVPFTTQCYASLRLRKGGEMVDRRSITRQEPTPEPKDKDLAMLEKDKDHVTIQALQKRLRERERSLTERDRQIQTMASQLDAMKLIDQDTRDRHRQPKRPTAMVAPER